MTLKEHLEALAKEWEDESERNYELAEKRLDEEHYRVCSTTSEVLDSCAGSLRKLIKDAS